MIALPKYANAVDGALLLQESDAGRLKQPSLGEVLSREYLTWQVMRTRQLLDYLQQGTANGEGTPAFVEENTAEIAALSDFPPELLQAAVLPAVDRGVPPVPALTAPLEAEPAQAALARWRDGVEATLPNLLKPEDVSRLERLLVRFVKLVPKEYRNGVHDGHVTIALEYREAKQFTEQAQALANELAPVWRRDRAEAFRDHHLALHEGLDAMAFRIRKLAP